MSSFAAGARSAETYIARRDDAHALDPVRRSQNEIDPLVRYAFTGWSSLRFIGRLSGVN